MKKTIRNLFVLFVLLLTLSNCKKNNSDIFYDRSYLEEVKAARKEISFYMTRNSVPGGTFAIAKGGNLVYSEGWGLASTDLEVPASRNTKFRIGALSENFTSLLYQKLVEEGILHPDSTVQAYFPGFPEKKFPVLLQHLVQQTSGIRSPDEEEQEWRGLNVSLKNGIERFKDDSLVAPPGTYQIPSMYNYNLLGVVMEEATGEHFQNLLKQYVTDTLGLENTVADNPFITIKGRSDFFDYNFIAQVINATFRDMRYRIPSEGLLSNAEDLVKLGNALLFSDYLNAETKHRLFEPAELQSKLPARMTNGWILMEDRNGRVMYGKSGSVTGGSAALLIYPEEELVIACATNLSAISEDSPVFAMARQFLADPETEEQNQEQQ